VHSCSCTLTRRQTGRRPLINGQCRSNGFVGRRQSSHNYRCTDEFLMKTNHRCTKATGDDNTGVNTMLECETHRAVNETPLLQLLTDIQRTIIIYLASATVAVDSSHMIASSSASWSRFSPPSNFVNGHVSTMWFTLQRGR